MILLTHFVFFTFFAVMGTSSRTAAKRTLIVSHQTRGLLTVEFDPSKSSLNSLQVLTSTQAGFQPGWLCSRDGTLYSVSRTHFPNASFESGAIFTLKKDRTGTLQTTGSVSSEGNGGVYCDISKDGKILSVANIDGSTVSIHSRSSDGLVADASQIFKYALDRPGPGTNDSQTQANPHQAAFDPSGEYMFVPDRGADALYVYQVSNSHQVTQIQRLALPPGTGPRHVTFTVVNQTRTLVYLVSELDNTIRVFTMDRLTSTCSSSGGNSEGGGIRLSQIQVASTLGPGDNRTDPDNNDLASEIAITKNGKFVYVTNRNTISYSSDVVSIYSLDQKSTHSPLTYLGKNATYGKIPRHFSLSNDPDNRYLAVANEVSNNLIILTRNTETGFLEDVVGNLTLGEFDLTLQQGPMAVNWQ